MRELLRRMKARGDRTSAGRQGKDEPAATGIYRGKIENVAEECAIGVRVVALERDVARVIPADMQEVYQRGMLLAELCSAGQPRMAVPT